MRMQARAALATHPRFLVASGERTRHYIGEAIEELSKNGTLRATDCTDQLGVPSCLVEYTNGKPATLVLVQPHASEDFGKFFECFDRRAQIIAAFRKGETPENIPYIIPQVLEEDAEDDTSHTTSSIPQAPKAYSKPKPEIPLQRFTQGII